MSKGQQEKEKGWEVGTSSHANEGKKTQIPLESSLEKLMHDMPFISPDACIYRVPHRLRSVNEKAYTPQIVSIGPLHHGKSELQAMENHKVRYLRAFLDRTNLSLSDCIRKVKDREVSIRNCYEEIIDLTGDEFVKMIILDSCLIIEVFLRIVQNSPEEQVDYLNKRSMGERLKTDMILLENQLPFFVIESLYYLAFPNNDPMGFLNLSMSNFEGMMILDFDNIMKKMEHHKRSDFEVKHFVDLLRICHLPSFPRSPSVEKTKQKVKHFVDILRICHLPSFPRSPSVKKTKQEVTPNATDLHNAGMKFEKGSSDCLLKIGYTTGVLKIPYMVINDTSDYVFRNIIALEDCHYPFDSYMTNFIYFMDMLIDTAKDVDLLKKNEILQNWLSDSSEVATLFNRLGMETILAGNQYSLIYEEIDAYCNVRWNRWRAAFKRDYCSTPWMFASTVAAIILLLLTLVQAICSIISL